MACAQWRAQALCLPQATSQTWADNRRPGQEFPHHPARCLLTAVTQQTVALNGDTEDEAIQDNRLKYRSVLIVSVRIWY